MSNLWFCLEALGGGQHVATEWARFSGEHFGALRYAFLRDTQKLARSIPCQNGCGCEHEVVQRRNGKLAAVCRCDPWSCEDFALTEAEATLLELNAVKFGRAVAKAFECDARMADVSMPGTWQIGAKFANCVPVLLTIQNGRETFRRVVTELTARQRQPFILLSPTSQYWDAISRELMGMTRAGCFDLETNLVVTPNGGLQPRCSPGQLLQAFGPNVGEQEPETAAALVFAIIEKLDANERLKAPTAMTVFRYYCGRGMSAKNVADKCKCSKATVIGRLKLIEAATGTDPKELRAYSPSINELESAVSDSRAKHIHRAALTDDTGDSDEERG